MVESSQFPTSYPDHQPTGLPKPQDRQRLIGRAEREAAMDRLDTALHDDRIDFQEYDTARDLVVVARTYSDISVAMQGIDTAPPPSQRVQATAKDVKSKAATAAKEGGRRLSKSLIRFALAVCLAMASLILVLSGYQTTAVVVALTSIAVYFTSIRALFVRSQKS